MKHRKTIAIIALILWIAGLILTMTGMNLEKTAGSWMTVAGSISLVLGLILIGVLWFGKRAEDKEQQKDQ